MKQLLIKIFLFLFTIVLLDQLFGIGMASVLKYTEKGDWGRNNYIFNEVNHDIVIFGSSRAIHHYDPKIFADTLGMSCYNCGEDGMGILLMYARYRTIIDRYYPELIVYEVLPSFDFLEERDNLKYLKYLRPYTNFSTIDTLVNRISSNERYKQISHFYRYNSVFVDIIAQNMSKEIETAKDYTYMPLDKVIELSQNENVSNQASEDQLVELPIDSLKLKLFEDMLMRCKASNIKIVLAASPMFNFSRNDSFASIKQLCQKYNVPFLDHYNDTSYCNHRDFFADVAHLNRVGAERFSSLLASEIKNCILE